MTVKRIPWNQNPMIIFMKSILSPIRVKFKVKVNKSGLWHFSTVPLSRLFIFLSLWVIGYDRQFSILWPPRIIDFDPNDLSVWSKTTHFRTTVYFKDGPLSSFENLHFRLFKVYLIYNGNFTIEMSSKKIANFLYRNLSSRIRIKWSFVARPKTREGHFLKFSNGSRNSTVAMAMDPRTIIYGDRFLFFLDRTVPRLSAWAFFGHKLREIVGSCLIFCRLI